MDNQGEDTMTLEVAIATFYPLLLDRTVDRISTVLDTGESVTVYRVGTIIRIDIKP